MASSLESISAPIMISGKLNGYLKNLLNTIARQLQNGMLGKDKENIEDIWSEWLTFDLNNAPWVIEARKESHGEPIYAVA